MDVPIRVSDYAYCRRREVESFIEDEASEIERLEAILAGYRRRLVAHRNERAELSRFIREECGA